MCAQRLAGSTPGRRNLLGGAHHFRRRGTVDAERAMLKSTPADEEGIRGRQRRRSPAARPVQQVLDHRDHCGLGIAGCDMLLESGRAIAAGTR